MKNKSLIKMPFTEFNDLINNIVRNLKITEMPTIDGGIIRFSFQGIFGVILLRAEYIKENKRIYSKRVDMSTGKLESGIRLLYKVFTSFDESSEW